MDLRRPRRVLHILRIRPVRVQQALDLRHQRVGQARLGDERVAARLARPFGMPGQRVPGQRHDRNVPRPRIVLQPRASLPSRPSAAAPGPSARCPAAAPASSRSPRCRCRPRPRRSRRTAGRRRTSRARPGSPRRRARAAAPAACGAAHRRLAFAGSRSVKVDPLPGVLSSSMRAAENLRQAAADRQAEAGAAVAARRRRVELAEVLEHLHLILRRNADAGVLDRDRHLPQPRVVRRGHRHRSRRRELQRVAQQVEHDLLDLLAIRPQRRHARRAPSSSPPGSSA